MTAQLDMDKIARGLGAKRKGTVASQGGYFGALQLLAEVEARFRAPAGGGRATDPNWTERRLVPLTPRTLNRLDVLATKVREHSGVRVEPMQIAALLLEKLAEGMSESDADDLVLAHRADLLNAS